MSTTVWSEERTLDTAADAALKAAARLWFLVAIVGQWIFLYYILAFYGPSLLSGSFETWNRNRFLTKGYIAGDTAGNLFFALHVLLAAIVAFGGALQLVPQLRARAAAFHRWNGRVFLATAMAASLAGLEMTWLRGKTPTLAGALAITLNAVLVLVFAVLAWRYARAREMTAHRRWALRAYLVANGVWFIRVGFAACLLIDRAHAGAFYRFWEYGCYLVPLAVLELYLRAREGTAAGRFAMAGGLFVLTALMGFGIFAVYVAFFRPLLQG